MSAPIDTISLPFEVLKVGSLVAFGLCIGGAAFAATSDQSGIAARYWTRYTSSLERRLRPMFIFTPGKHIALGQIAGVFAIAAIILAARLPAFAWVFTLAAIYGPGIYIDDLRRKRIEAVEEQLDNFIVSLANALKSTPSIGSAFGSVLHVIQSPLREEVELTMKEIKVGSSLDQALLQMASRVGSKQLDSALSAMLIGRQVGGNLPKVLEATAATIREMRRLEGVIKTKTADSRMQMWLIGAMPFGLVVGMHFLWPGYFDVLSENIIGYTIIGVVGASWIGAILLARKVLAVDI